METVERYKREAKCCRCEGPLGERVNLVQLSRKASWQHPTCCNLLSGYGPCATAVVCDGCIDQTQGCVREGIKFAIEAPEDGPIVYHAIESLEDLGPEPTFFISRDGKSIQCLVCGRTSRHPRDVQEKYCANCKQFHPIGAS